ncbi:tRNA 2-selenouridine(34) synthase MnmH [Dyadobacter sp. OTU695]|uniref:tRNA 2-selenouridine(34) synthase MnmH n=1 Tax=Dyadobacter sp. OTU695 TaxID=3043860 RepID=UPI00313F2D70
MIRNISVEDFFLLEKPVVLADVRTPAEFDHGHIPDAVNLPLFSNEERVQVGTTYKQIGREPAILLGFDLTGNKWSGFIRSALEFAPDKRIAVHCWRGGMRSGAMAWALDLYGFEVLLIQGGYKSYRQWAHRQFTMQYDLRVLGGMTGSGKTRLLGKLQEMGEQVVDLEELAQHQGSTYGSMNKMRQPTQEQFENNLAWILKDLDRNRCVWIEDENLNIGKVAVPRPLWQQMNAATIIDIEVDLQERVERLVEEYGSLDPDFLVECTERIRKRLGPVQTTQAIAAIRDGRMEDFIRLVLVYYDKTYRKSLSHKDAGKLFALRLSGGSDKANAQLIADFNQTIAARKPLHPIS